MARGWPSTTRVARISVICVTFMPATNASASFRHFSLTSSFVRFSIGVWCDIKRPNVSELSRTRQCDVGSCRGVPERLASATLLGALLAHDPRIFQSPCSSLAKNRRHPRVSSLPPEERFGLNSVRPKRPHGGLIVPPVSIVPLQTFRRVVQPRLTTQAQRPGPRDAWIATRARWPGSLQRMVSTPTASAAAQ